MRIDQVLSPTSGLFSAMPQTIWGAELDPTLLDIELFTKLGPMTTSSLVDYFTADGILATDQLAALIFQKYQDNWKRLWDAVKIEYDLRLTSSTDEKRTTTTLRDNTEDRDLKNATTEKVAKGVTVETDRLNALDTKKSGSEDRALFDQALKDSSGLNGGTVKDVGGSTETGGVESDETTTRNGTGTETTEDGLYGVGGSGVAPQARSVVSAAPNFIDAVGKNETRDLAASQTNTRTDALSSDESDTETRTVTDGLTFNDRIDETLATDAETETTTDETDTLGEELATGVVAVADDEVIEDVFHSEGSSPLRTYQALIQEEIEGRSGIIWNFTELIIGDVRRTIALNVWSRPCVAL